MVAMSVFVSIALPVIVDYPQFIRVLVFCHKIDCINNLSVYFEYQCTSKLHGWLNSESNLNECVFT